jgi:hypothetical protein
MARSVTCTERLREVPSLTEKHNLQEIGERVMTKAESIVLRNMVNAINKIVKSTHSRNCDSIFKDSAEYCCQGEGALGTGKRYVLRRCLEDIGEELLLRAYGHYECGATPDLSVTLLCHIDIVERFNQAFPMLDDTGELLFHTQMANIFIDFAETFEIHGSWKITRKYCKYTA